MEMVDDDNHTHETSDDDVDDATEVESSSTMSEKLPPQKEQYQYEVVSTSYIVQHMTDIIDDANRIMQLPPTITRSLLDHFEWDKEKLLERFFDGDQAELFSKANVINPFKQSEPTSNKCKMPLKVQNNEECDICLMELAPNNMSELECEHRFCNTCWKAYLTTKIVEEGVAQNITCPSFGCYVLVNDETLMRLVEDESVKTKYQHLVANSFVSCNKLLRWCPSPGCKYAIKVTHVDFQPVVCTCGHTFCFSCGENWHDPIKCAMLKQWLKKCDDDWETQRYIFTHTKACPKCNTAIEKDGGCNLMICKSSSCRTKFCWLCLGLWSEHDSSSGCSKFEDVQVKPAQSEQDKSKAMLKRYLFYYDRYMNHMRSLKLEHMLYASANENMEEMQKKNNMKWIDVQFLKEAVDVLCRCRQTLMYTYAFAYFLRKNNQSVIFEGNQLDLQRATESLSKYLERDLCRADPAAAKVKVQDMYVYCDGRRKALIEHVHEGYDNDWWDYKV